jgi:guanylate kinase
MALAVFVQPPSIAELRNRLSNRSTESEEKIAVRIAKAEYELSFASQFDVILINDKLDKAFSDAELLAKKFIAE